MADSISFSMGAELGDFVTQIDAGANAQKRLIQTSRQVKDAMKKQTTEMDKAGRSTKKTSKEVSGMSQSANQAMVAVKGMVTGLLGVAGALKLYSALRKEIELINQLQRESAQKGLGFLKIAEGYAQQRGWQFEKGGVQRAGEAIKDVMRGAAISDPRLARAALVSGHVAFGKLGEERQAELTNIAATFSKTMGVEASIAEIIGLMGKTGVTTKEEAYKVLGQVIAAQKESASVDPAAFVKAVIPAVSEYLGQGGTFEEALPSIVRGIGVFDVGGEEKGKERFRQAVALAANEKVRQAAMKKAGLTTKEYFALGLDERIGLARQWWTGAGAEERAKTVTGTEESVAASMWGAESIARQAELRKIIGTTTAAKTAEQLKKYRLTNMAQYHRKEAETAIIAATTEEDIIRGGLVQDLTTEVWKKGISGELDIGPGFWQRKIWAEGREKRAVTSELFRRRLEAVQTEAIARGDIEMPSFGAPGPSAARTAFGEQLVETMQAQREFGPGFFGAEPREVGKLDKMISLLEINNALLEEQNRNSGGSAPGAGD